VVVPAGAAAPPRRNPKFIIFFKFFSFFTFSPTSSFDFEFKTSKINTVQIRSKKENFTSFYLSLIQILFERC